MPQQLLGEQPRSYLLIRQDLYMAGADRSELISGDCVALHGVKVLKLLGDGMVVGRHCLVHSCQDVFVGHFLGRCGG